MKFYWTTEYQHDHTQLSADRGTALLVIDYAEIHTDLHRSSRSGSDPQSEALSIAKVFAVELIADRPNTLLCDQPMLVFQVQQC